MPSRTSDHRPGRRSPILSRRLREWIAEEASQEASRFFAPWILRALTGRTLTDLGGESGGQEPGAQELGDQGPDSDEQELNEQKLGGPITKARFRLVTEVLGTADITPARMQRALRESRRAERKGLSTLQWARNVQSHAWSERLAEKVFQKARRRLKADSSSRADPNSKADSSSKADSGSRGAFGSEAGPGSGKARLHAPPSPAETFVFLLLWEELGGTAGLAARREMSRQAQGTSPQN